ncbi:SWIM zinc finger family protein [Portibacter lacus]|uniref:SWIM-type domain-containing protein n=1 Tax=Portibacter lacus TaxID=1099794 RepID=A0AA37WDZ7_9BACT|nr:SWIM zinc finger family protein [Portibacter lacus]GLR17443.1 hypothetical protein GCM10007940_20580 [Portibacter lacus]
MNFSLEHFELHFPPEIIAPGEALYEKKAVLEFEEVEKNLWSYEIKDGISYEIEILISPSKVLNYSCDCTYFTENGSCKHIIASLYHLRLLKTKNVKQGAKVVRSVPKKLSIPNILNQIDPEDLKNFVRTFAKKNKKFSTSLKATFARSIELENNEDKYENILNSVIRPATGVDYRISFQNIKQFITISEQFDAQFDDAVSLKQYKEASYIIKTLMSKAAYVNHWTNSENEEILQAKKHFHKRFRLLIELDIAPSLRKDLVAFGLDLAERSYYHISHAEQNLLIILLNPLSLDSKETILNEILNRKLSSSLLHVYELEKLWTIRQYYIEKGIEVKEQKTPTLSSQSIYRISDRLYEFKAYKGLKDFLELFFINGQIRDAFLVKKYVQVLKQIGSKKELTDMAMTNLIIHKDMYFYRLLKESYPDTIDDFFETIKSKIAHKKLKEFQRLYLAILQEDDKVEELIDYMSTSNHAISHIYEFAEYISERSNRLTEVLIRISDLYLSEYMGIESSSEMKRLLIFLRKNKWDKELGKLQKHLLKGYEDRKSLKSEIKDL